METRAPFELDLVSIHHWMDFIHDRIGDEKLYHPSSKVPKKDDKRQEYDTYVNDIYNTGFGKFPKVSEKREHLYKSTYDFHAEMNGKLSPLARIWINQDQRKRQENVSEKKIIDETEDFSIGLFELVREKLPFDIKFRIISMVPSSSRIVKGYDRALWSELFPDDYAIDCQLKDSAFVIYHKYRIISKEFNNRMQKKLMELDSLNLAKIFGIGQAPNYLQNLGKLAYLLSFINTKRKFILGKFKGIENIDIYQDFPKIHLCLQSCYNEINNITTYNTRAGLLYFNSSIAFYSSYRGMSVQNELEDIEEQQPIYQNRDTEEFGSLFVEEEYVPKPVVAESEDDFIREVDVEAVGTVRHNTESLLFIEDLEEKMHEYKLRAYHNKHLEFKEIPMDDIGLELSNNSFEKTEFKELETLFPNKKLPQIATSPSTAGGFINAKDNYFNVLLRRKLKREVPELFSSIYDDNITLFKSLTISSHSNPYNHLILHLLLENGKEIPKDLDKELLLSKAFINNELKDITFVDFTPTHINSMFRNVSNGRRKRDMNGFSYLSLFSKENPDFDDDVKKAVIPSFGNSVEKVNLLFYGKYLYSVIDEVDLFCSHFPKMRQFRLAVRLARNQHQTAAGILQNSSLDFYNLGKMLSYDLKKIQLKALNANIKTIAGDETIEGETLLEENPLFEKNDLEDNCLSIVVTAINELEKDEIQKLEQEINIDLIRYPELVLDIVKNVNLDKWKELVDYFLDRGFLESYFIDAFQSYSEETRLQKEYYIYRRHLSKNPILKRPATFNSPINSESFILDIYCGLDVISNPKEFERTALNMLVDRSEAGYNVQAKYHILFIKLFIAKLYYENTDLDLFIDFLEHHFGLFIDRETIEKAEQSAMLQKEEAFELSNNRNLRTVQLFFSYMCKPKMHPQYQHSKLMFTLEKLSSYLVLFIKARHSEMVEALLTLGQNAFSNFNEVFVIFHPTLAFRTFSCVVTESSIIVEEKPGEMFEYETKFERRKELMRMMYHERITDPETKVNSKILDERIIRARSTPQTTNVLNLLPSLPSPFMLYAIEVMTPSQLIHQDSWGNTFLHILVEGLFENQEVYEVLVQKQPEIVNIVNHDLNSVLHLLAEFPLQSLLFSIGKMLVEKYGANKDLVNSIGLTAYEIAVLAMNDNRSLSSDKWYDLSWLLPTPGKTKKDLFMDSILLQKK